MLRLDDIMTRDVVTVSPELTLRDASERFAEHHISGAPVVAGKRVVGVVSLSDVLDFAAAAPPLPSELPEELELADWDAEGEAPTALLEDEEPPPTFFAATGEEPAIPPDDVAGPEWNAFAEHTVEEVMTRRIWALRPNTPVDRAAALMHSVGVHRVLVMRGRELLGIVTTTDIANAIGDHTLKSRVYVFDRKAERDERGWE